MAHHRASFMVDGKSHITRRLSSPYLIHLLPARRIPETCAHPIHFHSNQRGFLPQVPLIIEKVVFSVAAFAARLMGLKAADHTLPMSPPRFARSDAYGNVGAGARARP